MQGTQLDVLNAIADIQDSTSIDNVEDIQIAEKVGVEINVAQNALDSLTQDGYVNLEKIERLSGKGYVASLTSKSHALIEGDETL